MDEITYVEAIEWAEKNMSGVLSAPSVDKGIASCFVHHCNFDPAVAADEDDFRHYAKFVIVFMQACTHTLAMTRAGTQIIFSMVGSGWNNMSMTLRRKLTPLYQDCFPIRLVEVNMVNPPMLVNAVIAMLKVFLKKKISDRITLSWDKGVEGDRLLSNKYPAHCCPAGTFHGTNTMTFVQWLMPIAKQLDAITTIAVTRRNRVFRVRAVVLRGVQGRPPRQTHGQRCVQTQ